MLRQFPSLWDMDSFHAENLYLENPDLLAAAPYLVAPSLHICESGINHIVTKAGAETHTQRSQKLSPRQEEKSTKL